MADEWNFGQKSFDFNGADDRTTLADAIQAALELSGWELASWSTGSGVEPVDLATSRYLVRSDHATSDVWHYAGDGVLQRCGIRIGGDATAGRLILDAFLENEPQTGRQRAGGEISFPDASILLETSGAGEVDMLLICGEDGLYIDLGSDGLPASVGQGTIMTRQPWSFLAGTRDAENSFTTQGVTMDLFGGLRFPENRDRRVIMQDGLDTNLTGGLLPYNIRGVDRVTEPTPAQNNVRTYIGSFDSFFGGSFIVDSNGYGEPRGMAGKAHFGLPFTPFDDRWAVSPVMVLQGLNDLKNTGQESSSASNNLSPSSIRWRSLPFRQTLRICPRFAVVGHLLTPWQIITDDDGVEYRVVRVDDNGRAFNLGVEWPGVANEISIP